MPGDYDILAPIYNRVGMAAFASQMTPRLLNYAQQSEWLGRRVLDIGCGTGASCMFFASHGYAITGVDSSPAMLQQAQRELQAKSLNARLVELDIRSLQVDDAPDLVLALDVLNELDSIRDLETIFERVQNILSPGRLFIFDLHTIEGLAQEGMKEVDIVHDDADLTMIRQPTFDYERQIFTASYDIFICENPVTWQRSRARRELRAFPIQAVASLLRRQGFEVFSLINTRLSVVNPGTSREARVIFVAKRIQ